MAQVSLQVNPAGAYPVMSPHKWAVRLAETANAVAAAAVDDEGTAVTATQDDLGFMYILSHDATAGLLTIKLFHADTFGGTYRQVTNDALQLLGENNEVVEDELVLDCSLAANQGTILVGVAPSARELSGGAFVSNLLVHHKLAYSTDGAWNGTSINEIGMAQYKHLPSGDPA